MTHNIIGNETGRAGAHVEIRTGRARRATPRQIVAMHLIAAGIGVGASVADILIGSPVCLGVIAAAFLAWCVWPSR
nr:hypothetical protein [uncultured Brevundimonas sp.]